MQHPLKETLQARLVMLLAATGRRAEAHDVYRTVRLLPPGGTCKRPRLRALHHRCNASTW
ncbi:BTAD domain-containing putative transcriptional regulator [Streptomyces canus]|uniref:BTAD domain-containing putative transcriptional regulator n=1 Tax=Streptomyces canus TaxID=58343 RepID=UPI002E361152|nr:BTAD domain-containing putative transcriptional regulator [Streptomyces canus]